MSLSHALDRAFEPHRPWPDYFCLFLPSDRRKEQNVVKKGLGFNWGAAGLSTGLFTGVYLSDILAYAQPTIAPNGDRPRHVVFEGIDQLPQGPYGTVSRSSL